MNSSAPSVAPDKQTPPMLQPAQTSPRSASQLAGAPRNPFALRSCAPQRDTDTAHDETASAPELHQRPRATSLNGPGKSSVRSAGGTDGVRHAASTPVLTKKPVPQSPGAKVDGARARARSLRQCAATADRTAGRTPASMPAVTAQMLEQLARAGNILHADLSLFHAHLASLNAMAQQIKNQAQALDTAMQLISAGYAGNAAGLAESVASVKAELLAMALGIDAMLHEGATSSKGPGPASPEPAASALKAYVSSLPAARDSLDQAARTTALASRTLSHLLVDLQRRGLLREPQPNSMSSNPADPPALASAAQDSFKKPQRPPRRWRDQQNIPAAVEAAGETPATAIPTAPAPAPAPARIASPNNSPRKSLPKIPLSKARIQPPTVPDDPGRFSIDTRLPAAAPVAAAIPGAGPAAALTSPPAPYKAPPLQLDEFQREIESLLAFDLQANDGQALAQAPEYSSGTRPAALSAPSAPSAAAVLAATGGNLPAPTPGPARGNVAPDEH